MRIPPEIELVASLGWRVYPCSRHSKAARFKEPSVNASCDLDEIASWVKEYPPSNWRVVMQGSGIWGLDIDIPSEDHIADGIAAMAALLAKHGPLPICPTTRSGGGGHALFFKHHGEAIWGKTGHPAAGLDPRVGRLSVTIPPSIHITTGKPYEWLVPPWVTDPPKAPDWLLNAVQPPSRLTQAQTPLNTTTARAGRRLRLAVELVLAAPPGQANDTLNRQSFAVARHVAAGLLDEMVVVQALKAAAQLRKIPRQEAEATIRSGFRAGYAKPVTYGVCW